MIRAFLVLAAIFLTAPTFAKIWRVNNNTGIAADFTTIQLAHDGANSGDTLHVESSPTSYGGLYCDRKLVIIGPGYFLSENANVQALIQPAKVDYMNFNSGSEGSVVMGIDFFGSSMQVNASDIVIQRNKFSSPNGSIPDWSFGSISIGNLSNDPSQPANNIVITQNYGVSIQIYAACTGILLTNNLIGFGEAYGDETTLQCISMVENAQALIQNNIFLRGVVAAHNSTIMNNIMVRGGIDGLGNLISNNLGNETQFGTADGNRSNVNMSNVFVGTGSPDAKWMLKVGSPAIGAGYGSTSQNPVDAGMFGNQTPYIIAGQPPMPSIYSLEVQPVGSNSDPIDVRIKVRSNRN